MNHDRNVIPVLLSTVDIGGPYDILGVVHAVCVQSGSLVVDAAQTVKNWVGGELKQYGELIENALHLAMERLTEKARALGANAVIGVKITTADVVMGGAEIIVYGTAVKHRGAAASLHEADGIERA
jgi:uncharacterized protein YbjQ (UPF0145 family)